MQITFKTADFGYISFSLC